MSTLAQKIIANACSRNAVEPGEIVVCSVDLAMIHDSGGPRRVKPILEKLNRKVWDNEKVRINQKVGYYPRYTKFLRSAGYLSRGCSRKRASKTRNVLCGG